MKFDQLVSLLESDNESKLLSVGDVYQSISINRDSFVKRNVQPGWIVYVDKEMKTHRIDGPAVQRDDIHVWYKHGIPHRLDGPALYFIINGEIEDPEWYINGKRYSKEEFDEYIKGLDNKEDRELLGDLGQSFD